MCKRSFLFGGAVLAVLAGVLALWLIRSEKSSQPIVAPSTPQPSIATPTDVLARSSDTVVRLQSPGGPAEPLDPRWEERRRRETEDSGYEWRLPINFYGRVVDENELPIAGAKAWFQWSDLSSEGASEAEVTSDGDGFFSLVDKRGNGVSVRVTKTGYHTPQQGNRFRFENARFWDANYHEPDLDNPVLFHLRKKGEAQPLIVGEATPRMSRDGTPVRLDFMRKGVLSSSGQLEIATWLYKDDYAPRFFDWRAKLLISDGGFREHNDEFPFAAPEDGYEPQVEWIMAANAPDWKRIITKNYYFRFGSPPKYGRMEVRINGASQVVNVNYWLNPSGSHNLESDAANQITAR